MSRSHDNGIGQSGIKKNVKITSNCTHNDKNGCKKRDRVENGKNPSALR